MRNRVLLTVGAVALVAASCAQPEPQVLSEAPRSVSADEVSSPTETTERDDEPGRFIARCATEEDGGTPGMTFFTDGSQNVTDHCLSRYYIGVQPAPGALYVPDDQAGSNAPTRDTTTTATAAPEWTPSQPRTDGGPTGDTDEELDDDLELITDEDDPATGLPDDTDDPDAPETDVPDATTPSTPPGETTTPGSPPTPTDPSDPGVEDPAEGTQTDPSDPTDTGSAAPGDPTDTGSTAPGDPTTVPTGDEAPQPGRVPANPPVTPADPWGSLGSAASGDSGSGPGPQDSGPQNSSEPQTSLIMPEVLPDLQWPVPALPGSGPAS